MSAAPSAGRDLSPADIARQTRQLIKGFGGRLGGRERGPDQGEGKRVPRRHSYDVDDARAKPWAKIGDGSVAAGLAHREALLQTAKERYRQDWKDLPARAVREARERHDALAAELDALGGVGAPPIGRMEVVRQELIKVEAMLERAAQRLRRVDLTILQAMLEMVEFRTGRLFPALETIASAAGCHRNSVNGAIRRLKAHGMIDWVRRSLKTSNEGEFAPQREQTSNAYFFDHQRQMPPRTWQRYLQILVSKLRRMGRVPAEVADPATAFDALTPRQLAVLGISPLASNASP
jgi:predicted transcriptional regulator